MKKAGLYIILSSSFWLLHILYESYKRIFTNWDYWENHPVELFGWSMYVIIPMSLIYLGINLYEQN